MFNLLSLKDLNSKPTENMYTEDNRIKNISLVKNFHCGGLITLTVELEDYTFLKNLKLSPEHIFNFINLLLEMYSHDMDRFETLTLNSLRNKPCSLVFAHDPNDINNKNPNRILGIGNLRGQYIFIDEIIELLK